jgi:hypothetical protein
MKTLSNLFRSNSFFLTAVSVLALGTSVSVSGATLEGQNKGNPIAWSGVNLQGWLELDYIPMRFRFDAASAGTQSVKLDFPHLGGTTPGFQDLTGFTAFTTNAHVVTAPVLSTDPSGVWSYALTIKIDDQNPAEVRFYARIAAGAHLNGGSSLQFKGSAGTVQVHKPAPAAGAPDLAVATTGPGSALPGSTLSYSISYNNRATGSTAYGAQISHILPPQLFVITNSLPPNARVTGNTIFWDLGNLAGHDSGQLAFQAIVGLDAQPGTVLTNLTQILSSENDLNPDDNASTSLTSIVCGGATPAIVSSPTSVLACPGSSVTFSVGAAGSSSLVYQWRKEGAPLSGATSSTYTIASVTPADAGFYDVEVSTACGTVTSAAAILSMNQGLPVMIRNPTFRADGGLELQFDTGCSGTYYIQYSDDLIVWKISGQAVQGTGGSVSWVDAGPPSTDSAPSMNAARFYRVVQAL